MGDYLLDSGTVSLSVSGQRNLWAAQPADVGVYLETLYLEISAVGAAGALVFVRDGATGNFLASYDMALSGGQFYKFGGAGELGYLLTGATALVADLKNFANVNSSASPYWGVARVKATARTRGGR